MPSDHNAAAMPRPHEAGQVRRHRWSLVREDLCAITLSHEWRKVTPPEFIEGHELLRKGESLNVQEFLYWFELHRDTIISRRDKRGKTLLHLAVEYNCGLGVVTTICKAWPDAIKAMDNGGKMPLHSGMRNKTGSDVVAFILGRFPHAAKEKDINGFTPLYMGVRHQADIRSVLAVLKAWPPAIRDKNTSNYTPLHPTMIYYHQPSAVVPALLAAWPEAAREVDMQGRTPLHHGMENDVPDEALIAVLKAYPKATEMKDKWKKTPLHYAMDKKVSKFVVAEMIKAWPKGQEIVTYHRCLEYLEQGSDLEVDLFAAWFKKHPDVIFGEDQDGYTPLHTALEACVPTETVLTLLEAYPDAATKACTTKKWPLHCAMKRHTEVTAVMAVFKAFPGALEEKARNGKTPAEFGNTTGTTVALCDACLVEVESAVSAFSGVTDDDTDAPLTTRLGPIKDALNTYFQLFLRYTLEGHAGDYQWVSQHSRSYLDPAIAVIRDAVQDMKVCVAANPDKYLAILSGLEEHDHAIYDASFRKSALRPHGDPSGYQQVTKSCRILTQSIQMAPSTKQPTKGLIELVLKVRKSIPAFEEAVKNVVADAMDVGGDNEIPEGAVVITFRPKGTKSPYRMVEKALTKGPNPDYPDCSNILDVYGCLIECDTYNGVAALATSLYKYHTEGKLRICRAKDRFTEPSSGGWRDLMVNVLILDGETEIIFEIQVVLRAMMKARTNLNAHASYNTFRCFSELLAMTGNGYESHLTNPDAPRASSVEYQSGRASSIQVMSGIGEGGEELKKANEMVASLKAKSAKQVDEIARLRAQLATATATATAAATSSSGGATREQPVTTAGGLSAPSSSSSSSTSSSTSSLSASSQLLAAENAELRDMLTGHIARLRVASRGYDKKLAGAEAVGADPADADAAATAPAGTKVGKAPPPASSRGASTSVAVGVKSVVEVDVANRRRGPPGDR